ncbi:hypothetical protein AVEN_216860-1 [Araneus ventricosus]|uniref:RNase H type-1 domain-containing protein n=1 Tax=Araneus ventricosus TaxID=182803 RepID=A0A4Y2UWY1_ARAVE|nr:hypothetical protein AVEN_216860-1 [Araneus ventricosus]
MCTTSREGHRSAIERRKLGGHSISCVGPLRVLWRRRDPLWIPQPPVNLEDRISHGGQVPSNRTPIEVYTDGSKINDQTGSAFCAIANEAITKTRKAKLSPAITLFQAEMLVLKTAIEWGQHWKRRTQHLKRQRV